VTDVMYNSKEKRERYLAIRRLAGDTPWWTCSGCRDLQVGAGDFAETFALLVAPPFRYYGELGSKPDEAMRRRVAEEVLPSDVRSAVL
jgi:hypothetical protein